LMVLPCAAFSEISTSGATVLPLMCPSIRAPHIAHQVCRCWTPLLPPTFVIASVSSGYKFRCIDACSWLHCGYKSRSLKHPKL
jgi:hypothetical protein